MDKNTAGGEWSLSCAVVLGHSECLIHAQRARVRVKERHRGFGFVSRKSTSVVIIAETAGGNEGDRGRIYNTEVEENSESPRKTCKLIGDNAELMRE